MDTIFQALFSWQFLLFCLAISAVIFVVRKVSEYVLTNWNVTAKESKLWRELILPILPIFIGPTVAFFAEQYPYPFPAGSASSYSARLAFGLVSGLLSGLLYRVLKSLLNYKAENPAEAYSPYYYNSTTFYNPNMAPDFNPNIGHDPNQVIGSPDAPLGDDPGAEVRHTIVKE